VDLLKAAVVALKIQPSRGPPMLGTGFFIAPRIVATCAHVVADSAAALPVHADGSVVASGRSLELRPDRELFFLSKETGLDLALLRVTSGASALDVDAHDSDTPVLLSAAMALGDPMWTYGHPVGMFRAGQPATFRYEGDSRRSEQEELPLPRLSGTPVGAGFSGSPVVNLRTGAVCGMLCTSNKAGSAHLLSAADILARCMEAKQAHETTAAHRVWLRTLTDAQLRAGGWRFPGPRLRSYLRAAALGAQTHPYPSLPADVEPAVIEPPSLPSVYVRQEAEEQEVMSSKRASARNAGRSMPAEGMLQIEENCVVIGGPGAGKSSLLRAMVIALAGRLERDEPCTLVPVRVLAADMAARPLLDGIAASVNADLCRWLRESLSVEFFRDPPIAGASWLILIDGLDEIMKTEHRRDVVEKLAHSQDVPGMFRFVAATRPLPDSDLPQGSSWRRYELLPFDIGQLPGFAAGWFGALGVNDPASAAQRFTGKVKAVGLGGLARVPLMATMLCELFAMHPDEPLPDGRHAVYQQFISMLREHQYGGTPGSDALQVRAAVRGSVHDAEVAAERLHFDVFDLIGQFALARHDGETRSAVDLLSEWTIEQPTHLDKKIWRTVLRESLRRSGLLIERDGDFAFIHETIGEFLAAGRIAADPRSAARIRELFGRRRITTPPIPKLDSFTRFLIAEWCGRPDLTRRLRRVATRGGAVGREFISMLVADGIPLPAEIVEPVAADLAQVASDTTRYNNDRFSAAEALARMGDPRGVELLAALAGDRGAPIRGRISAATAMAGLGDPRGVELLAALAGDPSVASHDRVGAARELGRLGHQSAAELQVEALGALAADSGEYPDDRMEAARDLIELGDPRGAQLLANAAADPSAWDSLFDEAIETVMDLDDPVRAEILTAWARDRDLDGNSRAYAAEELARLGDRRGVELLAAIAADPNVHDPGRSGAARTLIGLKDPGGAEFLAALARDPGLNRRRDRCDLARALAELGDPRGVELLAELACDPSLPGDDRSYAANELARLGDGRGVGMLAELASDPSLPGYSRRDAARELSRLGDRRGVELLAAVASDPAVPPFSRVTAAEDLTELGDPRGVELLATQLLAATAIDQTVDRHYRLEAVTDLIELNDPRSKESLAALARNRTLDRGTRRKVRRALRRLEPEANTVLIDGYGHIAPIVDMYARASITMCHE